MLCMYFSLKRELLAAAKDTASGLIIRGMTGQGEGSKGLYSTINASDVDSIDESSSSSGSRGFDEEGGIELSNHPVAPVVGRSTSSSSASTI